MIVVLCNSSHKHLISLFLSKLVSQVSGDQLFLFFYKQYNLESTYFSISNYEGISNDKSIFLVSINYTSC